MICQISKVPASKAIYPLFQTKVPAGFPSPASDYMEAEIDFNKFLVTHPVSTYIIKVVGDSMLDAFIPDGAWLVVDRALRPDNNAIVVASIDGEFTVKRFMRNGSRGRLMPANKKYSPIEITEDMDFEIWGVVTKVIINVDKP